MATSDPAEPLLQDGVQAYQKGAFEDVLAIFEGVAAARPQDPAALYYLGMALNTLGEAEAALDRLNAAVRIEPRAHVGHIQRALALLALKRLPEALSAINEALALRPDDAEAAVVRTQVLTAMGRMDEAAQTLAAAARASPHDTRVLTAAGDLLAFQGRADEAAQYFAAVRALAPEHSDLIAGRALAMAGRGHFEAALALCATALAVTPDGFHPLNVAGFCLMSLDRLTEAIGVYSEAVRVDPNQAEAWWSLGSAYFKKDWMPGAHSALTRALEVDPSLLPARILYAHVLAGLKRHVEAVEAFEAALALDPGNPDVAGSLALAKAYHLCDWQYRDSVLADARAKIESGKPGLTPLMTLALFEDPALQRRCAEIDARAALVGVESKRDPKPQRSKIRIGYLSADLRVHPVAHLMADVFDLHDRSRFEIIAFSSSPPEDTDMHRRLRPAFDEFHDIEDLRLSELADFMASKEIEIAVDITGLANLGRTAVFNRRPAPVQVNFLGIPGTFGMDSVDYIIGDPIVTPPGSDAFYTEKVVRLPHCYQPNSKRPDPILTSRAAEGLPENAFVFCCFNSPHKITPITFSAWMRILEATPGSVLWLLAPHDRVEGNLRREAERHGMDPARLIFTPMVDHAPHLGRLQLADMVLDTSPYGAHTTASDALWSGVPVITSAGPTFASRVAASLVKAAGVPELDRSAQGDYEAYAIALAKDPERRSALRSRLLAARTASPLFDIAGFTRDLEAAYAEMSTRWRRGEPPASFDVSDLDA